MHNYYKKEINPAELLKIDCDFFHFVSRNFHTTENIVNHQNSLLFILDKIGFLLVAHYFLTSLFHLPLLCFCSNGYRNTEISKANIKKNILGKGINTVKSPFDCSNV